MMTIAQVAKRLRVTVQHARKLCRDGKLPATRFGKVWVVDDRDAARYVARPVGRPILDKPRKASPIIEEDDGL